MATRFLFLKDLVHGRLSWSRSRVSWVLVLLETVVGYLFQRSSNYPAGVAVGGDIEDGPKHGLASIQVPNRALAPLHHLYIVNSLEVFKFSLIPGCCVGGSSLSVK